MQYGRKIFSRFIKMSFKVLITVLYTQQPTVQLCENTT